MFGAILATAFVLDSPPPPDPTSLIRQLGSPLYSVRVSAEGELAKIGRAALPALRAARDSKDAEIRGRSVAILARIEDAISLQATPIGLDFRGVPLAEAIEAINRQAGPCLSLSPEEQAVTGGRLVSLRSADPVPFWKAVDLLCGEGGLHPDRDHQPPLGTTDGPIRLLDGPGVGAGFRSDSGPFRVQVLSVHRQSEIQLDRARGVGTDPRNQAEGGSNAPPTPPSAREFFLQLIATAEPRLSITLNGPTTVTEAVDDCGRSLTNPPGAGNFQHTSGYYGMSPSSRLRLRIDLNDPQEGSKSVRTLKGRIPVVVAMRRSEPLVIPLTESKGKVFHDDDVALTLIDHRPGLNNQPTTIQLAIKSLGAPAPPVDPGDGQPLGYRPDSPQQQIEIVDARGRALSWFPSGTHYGREETVITMTVAHPQGSADLPWTLRYHGIIRANAEVPFEFRDIPIP